MFKGTVTHEELEKSRDNRQLKMSSLLSAFKKIRQLEQGGMIEDEDPDQGQALCPLVVDE